MSNYSKSKPVPRGRNKALIPLVRHYFTVSHSLNLSVLVNPKTAILKHETPKICRKNLEEEKKWHHSANSS